MSYSDVEGIVIWGSYAKRAAGHETQIYSDPFHEPWLCSEMFTLAARAEILPTSKIDPPAF